MKSILLALLAASVMAVQATPLSYTFQDLYGGANPGSASSNGDVIGALSRFDIDRVTIAGDGSVFNMSIFMNYNNGDTGLGGIDVGWGFPTLHPGDVMISSGGQNWAISLVDHDNTAPGAGGLTAGSLYMVDSFLTAQQILGSPQGTFRPDAFVWGDSDNAVKTGDGSVNAAATTGSQIVVDINFTTNDAAFLHAMSTGDFSLMFAAATCGNDIVIGDGGGSDVPEPLTTALVGAGLAAIGLIRRRS
jgi:hypothetical protein